MANDRQQAIELAKAEADYWRERMQRAKDHAERAMAEYRQVTDKFRTAADFHRLVQERYGGRAKAGPSQFHPGVRLREAAHSVLESKGRATPDEIIAELSARGFEFGKYPRRQLHFALLHSDKVVKEERSGAWRWTGAEQPEMPLAGGEGSDAN